MPFGAAIDRISMLRLATIASTAKFETAATEHIKTIYQH
jgi:hypothetical protein